MVSGTVLVIAVLLGAAGPDEQPAENPGSTSPDAIRSALGKGKYPWYDSKNDTARPLVSDWDFDPRIRVGGFGDIFAPVFVAITLGIVCYLIVIYWQRYHSTFDSSIQIVTEAAGTARRVEGLPAGLRPDTDDPWAEAVRLRALGDYAGAIVRLFAHQLLTLDRLKLIRLVPGRTGRQLVRAVDDPKFQSWIDPTLRLFEVVYYGHLAPSAEAFEAVWTSALAFEQHVASRTGS